MRMSNDEAHQIARIFSMKLISGTMRSILGDRAREGYAAIDHQPFDAPFAAEAIKGEFMPISPRPPSGTKDELVTSIVHLHIPS